MKTMKDCYDYLDVAGFDNKGFGEPISGNAKKALQSLVSGDLCKFWSYLERVRNQALVEVLKEIEHLFGVHNEGKVTFGLRFGTEILIPIKDEEAAQLINRRFITSLVFLEKGNEYWYDCVGHEKRSEVVRGLLGLAKEGQ